VLISSHFTLKLPQPLLRFALATVLLLTGLKLLGVPEANWVLTAGLIALGLALSTYAVRAWFLRPRVAPFAERV
jgi:hypothetical protein